MRVVFTFILYNVEFTVYCEFLKFALEHFCDYYEKMSRNLYESEQLEQNVQIIWPRLMDFTKPRPSTIKQLQLLYRSEYQGYCPKMK